MKLSVFVLPVEQIKTFYKNYIIYPHDSFGRRGSFFLSRLGKWCTQDMGLSRGTQSRRSGIAAAVMVQGWKQSKVCKKEYPFLDKLVQIKEIASPYKTRLTYWEVCFVIYYINKLWISNETTEIPSPASGNILQPAFIHFCFSSLVSDAKPYSAKWSYPNGAFLMPVQFSNMLCIISEFIKGINLLCSDQEMSRYNARWVFKINLYITFSNAFSLNYELLQPTQQFSFW